ncbi:MAG: hypothetical protein AAB362_01385 [Patescibacteria group bacterium]
MNQDFWKKRLIQKKFLEYNGNTLVQVHWKTVGDSVDSRRGIDEELMRAFWNILVDEGIASLDYSGRFGLFNDGTMTFCGPRSLNSGAPLFFTNVNDAREYKMAFFLAWNVWTTAVVEMRIVG